MEAENFNEKRITVSENALFSTMLMQGIQNNAMLQAVLSNQADIISLLDPQIDADEHFKESMRLASDAVSGLNAHVLSSMQ